MIPVCQDAKQFMNQNKNKYDMIFVDVFLGRVVPDFVTNKDFLLQCRNSLLPDGCIGLNYIINDEDEWATVQATFASIFPVYEVVSFNINRVFVATYV